MLGTPTPRRRISVTQVGARHGGHAATGTEGRYCILEVFDSSGDTSNPIQLPSAGFITIRLTMTRTGETDNDRRYLIMSLDSQELTGTR